MPQNQPLRESASQNDAAPDASKKRSRARFILPAIIATLAFIADRASKVAIEEFLDMHYAVPVVGDYVRLVLWYNVGAAFGITLGGPMVHVLLSLFAMTLVGWMVWHTPTNDRMSRIGFGFILGGAFGNLYDRVVAGEVTDFIDIGVGTYRWPTFNLADSFVVIGIGLLIVGHFFISSREPVPVPDHVDDNAAPKSEESVSQSAN